MNLHIQRNCGRGFTLIELLLGLSLLGVILAIAFAALSFSVRSLERTDVLVREIEDMRISGSVLQGLLAQALPLMREAQSRQVLFHGASQAVEFIAPAPTQQGRLAGLYQYRLRFIPDGQGLRLVLDHQPYNPESRFVWSEGHSTTDLAIGLVSGSFSYFGSAQVQVPELWAEEWTEAESLPTLLRMQLERASVLPPWPEIVVPLHAGRVR